MIEKNVLNFFDDILIILCVNWSIVINIYYFMFILDDMLFFRLFIYVFLVNYRLWVVLNLKCVFCYVYNLCIFGFVL